MGYRCWKPDCMEEIPDGQEVWRNWDGSVVTYPCQQVVYAEPYHPGCEKLPGRNPGDVTYVQTQFETVKEKEPEDSFTIDSLPAPKQMGLFEEG